MHGRVGVQAQVFNDRTLQTPSMRRFTTRKGKTSPREGQPGFLSTPSEDGPALVPLAPFSDASRAVSRPLGSWVLGSPHSPAPSSAPPAPGLIPNLSASHSPQTRPSPRSCSHSEAEACSPLSPKQSKNSSWLTESSES